MKENGQMQEILDYIEEKNQEFAQLPIFVFLRNKDVDPRERLEILPALTQLILGFADVNKYFLRKEPTEDPIQAVVNQHTYEDDFHWKWFLEDLEKLGYDRSMKVTDTLRYLWSDETQKIRQVCFKLVALIFQAEPALKVVAIEALEATDIIYLTTMSGAAEELTLTTKQNYRYAGKHHLNVDSNHTIGRPDEEAAIKGIRLSHESRKQAFQLVDDIYDAFTEAMVELMSYVDARRFDRASETSLYAPKGFETIFSLKKPNSGHASLSLARN